jgi:hypothetical protein
MIRLVTRKMTPPPPLQGREFAVVNLGENIERRKRKRGKHKRKGRQRLDNGEI